MHRRIGIIPINIDMAAASGLEGLRRTHHPSRYVTVDDGNVIYGLRYRGIFCPARKEI